MGILYWNDIFILKQHTDVVLPITHAIRISTSLVNFRYLRDVLFTSFTHLASQPLRFECQWNTCLLNHWKDGGQIACRHGRCRLSWWRHQMETFSALLALCAGNSPVPGEFPAQRPVTRSFDDFFDLRPNKRLSKQSRGWWFKTPSRPLWRHCNVDSNYHVPNKLKARFICHSHAIVAYSKVNSNLCSKKRVTAKQVFHRNDLRMKCQWNETQIMYHTYIYIYICMHIYIYEYILTYIYIL